MSATEAADAKAADLARAVAAELGSETAAATARQLAGEETRAIGAGGIETVVVATFLVQCAQLAVQIWDALKNRAGLMARLEAEAPAPEGLDPEKRRTLIGRVVGKLAGPA